MARVLLLSRPGCHLCDDARAVIERVAGELGVGWEERDITTSPQDMAEYWDKIPVTFVDGVQVDFWRISEPRLRGAIHGGLLSRAPFPARAKRDGRTRHAKPTDSRRLRDFTLEIEVSAPDLSRYRGVRVHGLERKVARSGSVGSHGAEASGSRGPEASGRILVEARRTYWPERGKGRLCESLHKGVRWNRCRQAGSWS